MSKSSDLDETKKLMGALVRMKPKPHEELKGTKMKLEKPSQKRRKSAPKNDQG